MSVKQGRTYKAMISVISNIALQLVNTISNLILPSLLIGRFGSTVNGLISTIRQIFNYVQLIGTGISESAIVSLYKPINNNEYENINKVYNACAKMFYNAGVWFSLITLFFSLVYPLLIDTTFDYFYSVVLIIIMGIAGASEFFVLGKYKTLLIADQKIFIINLIQIVTAILIIVGNYIFISIGCDIVIVQLIISTAYLIRLIIMRIYIKKKYVFLDKRIQPDMSSLHNRKAALLHQISSLILFSSQTIIISLFCGLSEASVYSIYALVFNGLSNLLTTISSSVLPSFGNLIAISSRREVNKIYKIYECIYIMLTFIVITVALLMIIPFVTLYTNGILDANYIRPELGILFSVTLTITSIRTPPYTLISASGHYCQTKNRAIYEMILCLGCEILFVSSWGIVGVLIGTIVSYIFSCVFVSMYTNKYILHRSVIDSVKIVLINLVTLLFVYFIASFYLVDCSSYFFWIIESVIVFVITCSVFCLANYLFYKDVYLLIFHKYIKR